MKTTKREKLLNQIRKHVLVGQYQSGLKLVEQALRHAPQDFELRYQYAKLLGDWADELPLKKRHALKAKAVAILKPLTRGLSGKDIKLRFGLCVNYYYQSENFAGLYTFGKRFARYDKQLAHYAQALGAGLKAFSLYEDKKISASTSWAKKSVIGWKKYKLSNEKYYFAHYSFAKSLALAGEKSESLHHLKKAAKLGKRPLSDWEFSDVLKIIHSS